ncbi:mitochondrial ornithine transporter 1 [Neocloeon triangulifer]|uniref:mitochondrial ornithine transporter 1 n=1 Tax=Neocloeon triangulifer TaxID=2078957 RepID=UPI00286EE38C|nr:mitochondrial ornithine transporter 1 [Neocloeon triangulifer]XP_059481963.1 mitochondrial ornithine transporter 1 [Neocloeon triangulifer]
MGHGSGDKKASGHVLDTVIDFICGSLGGVASVYTGQPLDTVKVKMQTFPELYRGMLHCCKETWTKEGIIRGFYAGTTPALVANIAENSVLFAGYGACQKVVAMATNTPKVQDLTVPANATAGCMAAFFTAFALCPTELIKCRLQAMREMQAQLPKEKQVRIGPFGLTKQILKQEGVNGMFRGLTSTIAREMPGYFFFFGGYEFSRELFAGEGQTKDQIGALRTMASGAIGGILFWCSVFPADVVKSRIQVTGSKEPFFSLLMKIFKNEGFLALYNGLQPTVIRTIPASAALFLAYEYSKKFLHSVV